MVVLESMWKGPNPCWNFMESGSESATYETVTFATVVTVVTVVTKNCVTKNLSLKFYDKNCH